MSRRFWAACIRHVSWWRGLSQRLRMMRIHCVQLVEGALRSALDPQAAEAKREQPPSGASLLDSFTKPKEGGVQIRFLEDLREQK